MIMKNMINTMIKNRKVIIITLLWSAPLVIALTFMLPGDTSRQFGSKLIVMFIIGFMSPLITTKILEKLKNVKE